MDELSQIKEMIETFIVLHKKAVIKCRQNT